MTSCDKKSVKINLKWSPQNIGQFHLCHGLVSFSQVDQDPQVVCKKAKYLLTWQILQKFQWSQPYSSSFSFQPAANLGCFNQRELISWLNIAIDLLPLIYLFPHWDLFAKRPIKCYHGCTFIFQSQWIDIDKHEVSLEHDFKSWLQRGHSPDSWQIEQRWILERRLAAASFLFSHSSVASL